MSNPFQAGIWGFASNPFHADGCTAKPFGQIKIAKHGTGRQLIGLVAQGFRDPKKFRRRVRFSRVGLFAQRRRPIRWLAHGRRLSIFETPRRPPFLKAEPAAPDDPSRQILTIDCQRW
jgi:hypothetical protein